MKPLLFSILPRPPHPTRDGLAIRNYQILRGLAEEFQVRAFALRPPHLDTGRYPDGVEGVEVPQASRRIRQAAAMLESVHPGRAYSMSLYRSRRLARALQDAARQRAPSWAVAHSYHVGPLALGSGAPAWIDFHNVDSEIWRRMSESASPSRWTAAFARLQAARVSDWERRLVASASGVSCVSERDAQTLMRANPAEPPLIVPNGVDLDFYSFRAEPALSKKVFFVGDLSWAPNAEGIRWWRTEVWPRVCRDHPDARAEVLGRGAPPDLLRLADASFVFLGEGGDTRPHWREAAVAVVPLLSGGGTRLKILEAAASGVPVVATSIGAEGLKLERGSEIEVGDTASDFASAVSRLLSDPARGAAQARAARSRAETLYDWKAIGHGFAAALAARVAS